ncbi:MAG: hypothetical protein UMS36scaffold28_74 [Phage 59_13]|nr:MAG: hypothetical protein UMS36scaffold28_74 [Phage 59_13]
MKWLTLCAFLTLIPSRSFAVLSNFWASSGGYKLPREDSFPRVNCASCTLTRNWDGTTARTFGARNETVSLVLYMTNPSAADLPSVGVRIADFVGPNGAVIPYLPPVSGLEMRPIEVFVARYIPIKGMTQLSWDGSEYEERDVPERFRRPCTVNGRGTCAPNAGTVWTDRPDHDKSLPEMLLPYEAVPAAVFIVPKQSSQAAWFDIWISSTLPPGTYASKITVTEIGQPVRVIPVELQVYDAVLPDAPALSVLPYFSNDDVNYRHTGNRHPGTAAARTLRDSYARLLHRHKVAATFGDDLVNDCGQANVQRPCPEYVDRLKGLTYSAASGYANGPGIGRGDSFYSIGTYGSWSWSRTQTAAFCSAVNGWSSYMGTNFPAVHSFVYLADEPASLADVNRWSTWMATACATAGAYKVGSFVTADWPRVNAEAPRITDAATTSWLSVSSATWVKAQADLVSRGATVWGYNSHPSHTGSIYATEDDGIAPVTIAWAMFKKGVRNWFLWQTTYWTDINNEHTDNDLWNDAVTFGWVTTNDPVKGRTGFQASNGDGVLLYPGTDVTGQMNFNVPGPIASWRLKMLRRGIQDGDYLTLARQKDALTTEAILTRMVPNVLYEHACYETADCSYAYGGRSWTNDPGEWESAREKLLAIFANAPPIPPTPPSNGTYKSDCTCSCNCVMTPL